MYTFNCNGKLLIIQEPIVMGIVNITSDSFYAGSRHDNLDQILSTTETMIREGATIIDIGGQSTRPNSIQIPEEEELKKVVPVIEEITKRFPDTFISIDTYWAKVAEAAVHAGAHIVNDISAGNIDPKLIDTVAKLNVPYILMHMQGTPQNMQAHPQYTDVCTEVLDFFITKKQELENRGIKDIILDPGFGFGKTIQHNFQLLKNLSLFKILETALLLGISRKSSIYKTLNINAEEALNGSTVLHTIGLQNGAQIIRAHDVKQAMECIKLLKTMNKA
ncbi:MAG: dihydropteroate synthase [Bacteroidia bacterium]|nr:MAG: dihydropteroate synthase [Bacteroidia bacterium]